MKQNNEKTNALLIHISSFAGYLFPFGSIIAPLVLWQTQKDKSRFLDEQGKEAVNFNVSFALYTLILGAVFFTTSMGTIFNLLDNFGQIDFGYRFSNVNFFSFFGIASAAGVLGLIKVALIIIAALKSQKGEDYRYPFTIKFIK